jgi:DNA-binding transcriptional regulator YiaG
MDRKFKSEAMEALYEDAFANFEVGGISEERMHYYEKACLVPEISAVRMVKRTGAASAKEFSNLAMKEYKSNA